MSNPEIVPASPWWKNWTPGNITNLIATVTALIVAITALMRPETSARKVYAASVVADTHISSVQEAQQAQLDALQTAHTEPAVVLIHTDAGSLVVKDAGLVATLTPLKLRPLPAKGPVGFKPPSYEAVTGTSDTGLTLTH